MNRAVLPSEMLQCTDMAVLERQKAAHMKWLQQQEGCYGNMVMSGGGFQGFEDGCLGEVVTRSVVKTDLGMVVDNTNNSSNNGWCDLVSFGGGTSCVGFMSNNSGGSNNSNNAGCGFGLNFGISRTSSCPPGAMEIVSMNSKARDHQLQQQHQSLLSQTVITTSGDVGRESLKKRKLDKVLTHNTKVVAEEEEGREKKIKVCAEDGESKITEKQNANKSSSCNSNKNSNNKKENSSDTSKDNSKVTEVQKPDYIHVRARRGQATDSHSLAERVRREKISERMKYLQDLVPGCNKITGKAGMLDEIINYVQSLQRQVEFLSMKLAAVNPRLDFNIDNLFAKETFSACATNFPTIGMSSDMTNPAYHQFNPLQQQLVTCGLDMGVNPPDMTLRRTISAPVTLPDTFLDSSCFTQTSTWDADLQNLYNVAFDQARPTSYPSQQFTGSIEACNMKMEM